MSIRVECDSCFASFSVKVEAAGRSIKCKECGEKVRVPRMDEAAAPVVGRKRKKQQTAPKDRRRKKEPVITAKSTLKYGCVGSFLLFALMLFVGMTAAAGVPILTAIGMTLALGGFVWGTIIVMEDADNFALLFLRGPAVPILMLFNLKYTWIGYVLMFVGVMLMGAGGFDEKRNFAGPNVNEEYYENTVRAE